MLAEVKEKVGKGAARQLRRDGRVPGIIYGGSAEPTMISLDPRDIWRGLNAGGFFAKLIDLDISGKAIKVLPRAIQFDKVKDQPIHVDFMRVDDSTILTVKVPVRFENELASPGLKRGAVLNVVRHEVEVKCKASTLPDSFSADLTGLEVNDAVKVSSLNIGEGVAPTIKDRDFVIATVTAPSALKRQMADEQKAGGDGEGAEGEAEG